MYKKMLVPLDGSQLAEGIFTYARELAWRLGLEVIILHVCTPDERGHITMHRAYIEQSADIMRHQLTEIQQSTGFKSGGKAVKVKSNLVVGYPAEEILRYADENEVDFILIATHGYSGIKKWSVSSVADKVLRASKIPVFLVRSEVMQKTDYDIWPPRRFLVPLDGSKYAESVLPHVETLAKQRGIKSIDIFLLMVYDRPSIPFNMHEASKLHGWEEYIDQHMSSLEGMYKQYLAGIEKVLKCTNLKVTSRVVEGNTANTIIEFGQKNPLTLAIMTSHGRSGYCQGSYGNVVDKVLHRASIPIFLVRPNLCI